MKYIFLEYLLIWRDFEVAFSNFPQILVKYRGALPDLFREGHSVVAEGFLKPYPEKSVSTSEEQFKQSEMIAKVRKAGCFFAATEVLAKHDEVCEFAFMPISRRIS